jgi:7-carboxy-7-deazaguanine synthase
MSIDELMDKAKELSLPLVCVTGGEPLEQENCIRLIEALLGEGFTIDLETNGSKDIGPVVERAPGTFLSVDVKTPSSGMSGTFLLGNLALLGKNGQLKFVVKDQKDLDFTFAFLRDHPTTTNIVITPCGNKDGALLAGPLLSKVRDLAPVQGNLKGRIRFMVQSHKVIWDEGRRGV